jgi:hypothetical protein
MPEQSPAAMARKALEEAEAMTEEEKQAASDKLAKYFEEVEAATPQTEPTPEVKALARSETNRKNAQRGRILVKIQKNLGIWQPFTANEAADKTQIPFEIIQDYLANEAKLPGSRVTILEPGLYCLNTGF